jgi:hypothetical protein
LSLATDLVNHFNDLEINTASLASSRLSLTDYQLFVIAQLILNDVTNVRFLWKRISKAVSKEDLVGSLLNDLQALSISIGNKEFALAFTKISQITLSQ